jgi:hypothetical protein
MGNLPSVVAAIGRCRPGYRAANHPGTLADGGARTRALGQQAAGADPVALRGLISGQACLRTGRHSAIGAAKGT